jgi:hypothetical protein
MVPPVSLIDPVISIAFEFAFIVIEAPVGIVIIALLEVEVSDVV